MQRREFLELAGWSLAALAAGCARPPSLREAQMLTLDPRTGSTLETRKVAIPAGRRSALDANNQGFLFADGQSVLALDFSAQTCLCEGPGEALWVRPDLLVTGEKSSSDVYRVSGVHFPSGRSLWRQESPYGELLGFHTKTVYVRHTKGVSCFDLDSGKELWQNSELTELKSWYVLPSSLVVGLGNAGQVCWIDLQTGKILRSLTTTTTPNRVILVAGDDEYTLTVTRRIALAAFRPNQTRPAWVQRITGQDHQTELLGYADRIALIALHESSVALDVVTGGTLWSDSLCTHISIGQGVALLRRGHGQEGGKTTLEIEARQLRSGKSLWKRQLEDIHATTAVHGEQFALLTG